MLLKRLYMISWLKKLMLLVHANKILIKKIEDVNKTIPDTSKFLETQKFTRLTKINLARMTEAPTNLATNNQVETTLDLRYKKEKKFKNFKCLVSFILLVKVTSTMVDPKIMTHFKQFLSTRRSLLAPLIKLFYGI